MTHIADARTRAGATLGSTCDITGPSTGPVVIDDDTGVATRTPGPTIHADEPCSVGDPISDLDRELAGVQLEGVAYWVRVRAMATGIQRGHTLTVTAVDEDGDPDLVGVALTVDKVPRKSKVVLRRLVCVDTRGTSGRLP